MKLNILLTVKQLLCIVFFLCISCDSFVDVGLPTSQLTKETVFTDRNTANAAMSSVYASIRDQGILTGTSYGISNNLGVYSDELQFYGGTSYASFYFFNNALLPSNPYVANYWNASYSQIYGVNAILEGVQQSKNLLQEDVQRLKGESLFVRALLHFYLVNLFGDIPYVTTTDYSLNTTINKWSSDEVYNLIITDLKNAINLLPEVYYTAGRARPNKYCAEALLSRVYLYHGDWAEAANSASVVLNNTSLYYDDFNLANTFLNNCSETIWQLPPATEGRNTDEADTFILFSGPPTTVALNENLVNTFTAGDLRRTAWIGEINKDSNTWHYANKYKQATIQATSSEYAIVLRLPEQYLIRAEARLRQGDYVGAKADLNHIRLRAGLTETTAVNEVQILEDILLERKLEFFTEYGHRFFDLKRFGQINSVLGLSKPGWDSADQLFPIPQSELSANPNLLPQNPGY